MPERLRAALAEVSTAAHAFSETMTDYDTLLKVVARSCAQALRSTCSLSLFGNDPAMVTPVAVHDDDPRFAAAFGALLMTPRRYDQGLLGLLAPGGGDAFVPEIDLAGLRDRVPDATYASLEAAEIRGLIAIVMRVRGEALGILTVLQHGDDRPPLDEIDREVTMHLANLAGLAISNARLYRRAQEELAARISAEEINDRLRASEERERRAGAFLDTVLEHLPAMVFVKEAEHLSFVRLNRAGEQILGLDRSALIGKTDFDLFPRPEAEFFVMKDRETLQAGLVVEIAEEPIRTARGERWLYTRKVPLVDDDGVSRYLVGISYDITDRRRDVAALRRARETVEAANRELEAFSYSVAHDLRAPLRAIDGFSQALLEDCADQLGEAGRGYCARVRTAAQRMAALIDDLLALARVSRAELHRQPVDLGGLFRSSLAVLRQGEPERRVETLISGDVAATGDPKLLAVVLDNLVGNAWKFTAREPAPRIELSVEDQDGERVFCVADNGAGFDMAYSAKLFGVFNRLHPDHEFEGTGVGLAIVHRIVTRHGGRVWAQGEVGEGARLYFTLGDKEA